MPDVMAQSGAVLREVGTTNRTRTADYAAAIGGRTAAILRVHPSNFRIEGFTERPRLEELTALARRFKVPLIEDIGSGWIGPHPGPQSLADEPAPAASQAAGADLVLFSGDKLLGGPQAGIIVGSVDHVNVIRKHPLCAPSRGQGLRGAQPPGSTAGCETVPMFACRDAARRDRRRRGGESRGEG